MMTATARRDYTQVFVVIRVDLDLIPISGVEGALRAVEVLPTVAEARAECARLNASADPAKTHYVVSASHWYPQGRQVQKPAPGDSSPPS